MGFGIAKAFLFLQLSLFLVGSFAADSLIGPWPRVPPVWPRVPPGPPGPPIVQTFKEPIRVQGGVYLRSCNHSGPIQGQISPVSGATIQMQCDISGSPGPFTATTNQYGLFSLQGPASATLSDAQKCKVSLGPCPFDGCKQPSPFNNGAAGVNLGRPSSIYPFFQFSVGPWAYEPNCP